MVLIYGGSRSPYSFTRWTTGAMLLKNEWYPQSARRAFQLRRRWSGRAREIGDDLPGWCGRRGRIMRASSTGETPGCRTARSAPARSREAERLNTAPRGEPAPSPGVRCRSRPSASSRSERSREEPVARPLDGGQTSCRPIDPPPNHHEPTRKERHHRVTETQDRDLRPELVPKSCITR
jgi:hypothetical protein